MATDRVNDLRAFKGFIDQQLANDGADLTVDEALARWEDENQTDEERQATVQAVQEALADMRAGDRGIPSHEATAELRRKYNLPELS